MKMARRDFGYQFIRHQENALSFILISGRHMKSFSSEPIFSAGKDSGNASRIERFNLTLRQRAARLGRKTLSFSENMQNHIEALWNFIRHHNKNIAPK